MENRYGDKFEKGKWVVGSGDRYCWYFQGGMSCFSYEFFLLVFLVGVGKIILEQWYLLCV